MRSARRGVDRKIFLVGLTVAREMERPVCAAGASTGAISMTSGHAVLLAMLAALEVPALFKDLFEGFLAVGKRHPGVAVPLGTREPDCKVPSHNNSPRFFIIPRHNRQVGGTAAPCFEM